MGFLEGKTAIITDGGRSVLHYILDFMPHFII